MSPVLLLMLSGVTGGFSIEDIDIVGESTASYGVDRRMCNFS